MKKKFWIGLLVVGILIGGVLNAQEEQQESRVEETTEAVVETTEVAPEVEDGLGFLDDLGYSDVEVAGMKEILVNVGISEIWDTEIGNEVAGMRVIKGLVYEDRWMSKEVRVQVNIENGVVYLVSIYCPSYHTENQIPYLDGLTDRRADLYYDTDGGYLNRIDWENQVVVDWED